MPFLDTLIMRKADGHVKLLVYRKTIHTDQYLHFSSHRPLQQKLSVNRTLMDKSISIVNEEEDRKQEEQRIQTALSCCGYPEWCINKVERQMSTPKQKKVARKPTKQYSEPQKATVVIPYTHGLLEAVIRVYECYSIPTSMRPSQSLRSLLVHTKDKPRLQDVCECVYKILCRNCDKTYIGETCRAFGVMLQEHRQGVSERDIKAYTQSTSKSVAMEQKSQASQTMPSL